MRIVSYNIRLALDSSLGRIADVITAQSADLVCLQEVGRHWTMGRPVDMSGMLSASTGLPFVAYAPAIQDGASQYGIAVLSRHEIEVLERRPLPRKADEPRVVLACRVVDPCGPYLLVTSHVSVVDGDRPDQLDELTRWCLTLRARERLPLIVAGDFNAELSEPALRRAMSWMHLRSAHLVNLGQTPPTYPTGDPRLAIDHILLTRDLEVVEAGVDDVEGSDHLPVWAELRPAQAVNPRARR